MSANAAAASRGSLRGDALFAGGMVGVLALTVMPLPTQVLDVLLALSLCTAVLTFLVAAYVESPLDFSSFPSLLLFVTLFRLALNVASTRIILLHGGEGEGSAGQVIQAFGQFAVGSNFVVGGVVFLILVIVNFIVITKGAERISEVAARFTLDSMPGKQMAIDADLGAGLIDEKEARGRRTRLEEQADFYGSMDGASKFVRGDAVAGLMIVAINIVGGMIIGVAQRGMSASDAATTYTILSIGDGLISQIPGLLVSTGAALLTTRSSAAHSLGGMLSKQLLGRRRPLNIAAIVLGIVGIVPGMPTFAFLILAAGAFALARVSPDTGAAKDDDDDTADATAGGAEKATAREEIEALLPVELLSLDVGLDLLSMVNADRDGQLLRRIASVRKQIASDLGLIVPPVHVRDDLSMRPGGYRIVVSGVVVAEGEVSASRVLAIDPSGESIRGVSGKDVREPTFGLPARWIDTSARNKVEAAGGTVVAPSAVIATHLAEVIRRNAHDLLGRREAQDLLDLVGKSDSRVIEELIPTLLPIGTVIKVLRNLLRENVSIRDMRTILEALADSAPDVKDADQLTELVRHRLARRISRANAADGGELCAMVLDPAAEDAFRDRGAPPDARLLSQITARLERATTKAIERDEPAVLVVAPDVRRALASIAERHIPGLVVLSHREIDPAISFITRGVITAGEALV